MNTLICKNCKRLWVPETKGPCPKCGGELKQLLDEDTSDEEVPDSVRFTYMTKKLVTAQKD
jgi:hypothetical protein